MADVPVTALVELDAPDVEPDDVLMIVDVHDFVQSPAGSTKKVTLASLLTDPPITGTIAILSITLLNSGGISMTGDIAPAVANARSVGTVALPFGTGYFRDLVATRQFYATGAAPNVVAGSGAGSGAAASVDGNDTRGVITLNAGTGTTTGTWLTLTFAHPFSTTPVPLINLAAPGTGDDFSFELGAVSSTAFTLVKKGTPVDGITYLIYYHVIG